MVAVSRCSWLSLWGGIVELFSSLNESRIFVTIHREAWIMVNVHKGPRLSENSDWEAEFTPVNEHSKELFSLKIGLLGMFVYRGWIVTI